MKKTVLLFAFLCFSLMQINTSTAQSAQISGLDFEN